MNPTLDTIHSLRSIHGGFTDRKVTEEDLATVLTAATRAANSSARQAYSIVVVQDTDRMDTLIGYRASHALVFCADFRRQALLAERLGHRFSNDDVIGFVTATVDTVLAAQTAVIAARSLGIDSLITNGLHRRPLDLVHRELGLPETSVFPLIALMLGYPEDDDQPAGGRLPVEAVVHRETYRDPDDAELDGLVAAYDDPARRLGLSGLWDRREFTHYLDWFFLQWCGEPDPDRVPTGTVKEFQDRLVRSGFWWPER
ncbi:MAG: nitroreductase [Actinomycetales bacterium]|nr:nitroreductase [Actinomycetales bacterium]